MSSHHFVREGQEPALFIIDPLSLTLVEPLLEWAPVVIVSHKAINDVLKWKIKIDVVVLQEGVAYPEELTEQGPVKILYYYDLDVLPDVISTFLVTQKCSGINIIAESSDDVFNRWLPNVKQLDIAIINADTKWSTITSTFQKWLPARIKLCVRTSMDSSFQTIGLTRDSDQSFITERDGIISIQSNIPFWLGEPLEF